MTLAIAEDNIDGFWPPHGASSASGDECGDAVDLDA